MADRKNRDSTSVRIRPDLHAELVKRAEAFGVSMSWLTNKALEEALQNMVDPTDFRLTRRRRETTDAEPAS